MDTIGSNFDLIMQELMKQKQILEELEAENLDLRRQLADLRAGHGIVVEILGKEFSLIEEPIVASDTASIPGAGPAMDQSGTSTTDEATTPIPEILSSHSNTESEEEPSSPTPPAVSPTFLEEMLLEELASASTSQMDAWTNSSSRSTWDEEEEKAALRRQLSGSFLLE